MKIRLEKGSETTCPNEHFDLINGVLYEKTVLDQREEDIVRNLYAIANKFKLNRHPLDIVAMPQAEMIIPEKENTILRPELAMLGNGDDFSKWVIEFADEETEEISCWLKPVLYREAGVREYWVIRSDREAILIYVFHKTGLIPIIVDSPQRIRCSAYPDLFIAYSDVFKKK